MPSYVVRAVVVEEQEWDLQVEAESEDAARQMVLDQNFDPDISKTYATSNGYSMEARSVVGVEEGRIPQE